MDDRWTNDPEKISPGKREDRKEIINEVKQESLERCPQHLGLSLRLNLRQPPRY